MSKVPILIINPPVLSLMEYNYLNQGKNKPMGRLEKIRTCTPRFEFLMQEISSLSIYRQKARIQNGLL